MSDFTYTLPVTKEKYLLGILRELKRTGETMLYSFLKGSQLSIDDLGTSYYVDGTGRWNAKGIKIKFYVNPGSIDTLNIKTNKEKLFSICNTLIPGEVGFDLKEIVFVPELSMDFDVEEDILTDLESQVSQNSNSILKRILPYDIREKGVYMSEVYTYLYSVENSLRVFIELVGKENYGEEYFRKFKLTKALETTISGRKEKAKSKKWLSVRVNCTL